jgi:UDP-3-O-[3-hydroxymyristoyl] glucosamine N-acyltransferase
MSVTRGAYFTISLPDLAKYARYSSHTFKPLTVTGLSTTDKPVNNTIMFANKISGATQQSLLPVSGSLILVPNGQRAQLDEQTIANNEVYECKSPRLEYAILLNLVLDDKAGSENTQGNNSFVSPKAVIGKNVIIEDLVYIDEGVTIGDNCVIKSGARIYRRVNMGHNCIVGPNTVVGYQGFGIEKDEEDNNIRIPHFGGVQIGNYVQFGALNTVVSGTIHPTIVEDYVKVDDHVHIAHNVHIGKNSIITAGTIFSGSVTLKENCWMGPNTAVKQKTVIGKDALIGIGAVVLKDVPDGAVIVGNPGKPLQKG